MSLRTRIAPGPVTLLVVLLVVLLGVLLVEHASCVLKA